MTRYLDTLLAVLLTTITVLVVGLTLGALAILVQYILR